MMEQTKMSEPGLGGVLPEKESLMSGPNNYGVKLGVLLKFIHKNPQLTRNEILCRLGSNYLSAFNRAKHLKIIRPDDESTYRRKRWIIKGGEGQCGKSSEEF